MNLQYALLAIGLVIVVVVALTTYDRSRPRRPRMRMGARPGKYMPREIPLPPLPKEALPEASHENILHASAEITPREVPRHDVLRQEIERLEEVATMPLDLAVGKRPSSRSKETSGREYRPDEKIDFIINLTGEQPVSHNTALGIYKQLEYRLNKPRHLYGRQDGTAHWSELQLDSSSRQYGDLALALQMVDQHGPVDESELNVLTDIGLQLADALHRPMKLPLTFEQGLARAQELQKFCDTYDVVAAIHIVPAAGKMFEGRAIDAAARQAGMALGARNFFHMKNTVAPGSRVLFSLSNLGEPAGFNPIAWGSFKTAGLALSMVVPRAYHPGALFDKMTATARTLAEALDGQLQDQDRRPLTEKGVVVIRQQIEEIEEKMRAFGIPPGSETALRLFNESAAL